MPKIDWSAETSKAAGVYYAEVSSSVEMQGRDSGMPYFLVTFKDIKDQAKICHDIISFSPNAMNMSIAKLKALGFDKGKTQIEADELIARRCWIATKVEHQEGYEPRLVVDISAKDEFRCGYKPDTTEKPNSQAKDDNTKDLDDDIPF